MRFPQKITISLYIFLITVLNSYAIEWTKVTLSGNSEYHTFSKEREYEEISSFSFILKKFTSNGDITFLPYILDNGGVDFIVNSKPRAKIGMYSNVPTSIPNPQAKDFYTNGSVNAGEYYLLRVGDLTILLQIVNTQITKAYKSGYGILGYVYTVNAELEFRYISSSEGIDGIREIIFPNESTTFTTIVSNSPTTNETKSSNTDPSFSKASSLLVQYETLMKDLNDFLELSTDEVTLDRCDALIFSFNNLEREISDLVIDLKASIAGNKSKIASIEDQLSTITDLQVKDRASTKLNSLEAVNLSLLDLLNQWNARSIEVNNSVSKLKDYRKIIF